MKMVFTYDISDVVGLVCLVIFAVSIMLIFISVKVEETKDKFRRWKNRRQKSNNGNNQEEGKNERR